MGEPSVNFTADGEERVVWERLQELKEAESPEWQVGGLAWLPGGPALPRARRAGGEQTTEAGVQELRAVLSEAFHFLLEVSGEAGGTGQGCPWGFEER